MRFSSALSFFLRPFSTFFSLFSAALPAALARAARRFIFLARASILRSASMCSLEPFFMPAIFFFRAAILASSALISSASLSARAFILAASFLASASAALCSFEPFLYFCILALSSAILFLSLATSASSFFSAAMALASAAFAAFTLPFRCLSFAIAALCAFEPFFILDIFFFSAAMRFSSALSFFLRPFSTFFSAASLASAAFCSCLSFASAALC